MYTPRQEVKKKKRVLTAGVYIGILSDLLGEDKETLIETELSKIKKFAKENNVTIVQVNIDRDDSGLQKYKFDADYATNKFKLKYIFIER